MNPTSSLALPPSAALQHRAGDSERSAVCDQLSSHFAAGRLREDELDARLEAAVHAGTLFELHRLTSDLPPLATAAPVPAAPPRPPWTVLDVMAVLVMIGCLGFAGLMVAVLGFSGAGWMIVLGFLGGSVAALGGAAAAHLAHRSFTRALAQREAQRPRIA